MDDVKSEKPVKFEDGNIDDEEAGEDPNEYLEAHPNMVESSVWLVKVSSIAMSPDSNILSILSQVPKGLMERWSAVKEEDVPLATLRMYKGYSRGVVYL